MSGVVTIAADQSKRAMTVAEEQLVAAAIRVRQHAYAKFSQHAVGAALLAKGGPTFLGVNVENSAYGSTLCAERVAVGAAITAGCRALELLAIAVPNQGAPCGACRQVLFEFAPQFADSARRC